MHFPHQHSPSLPSFTTGTLFSPHSLINLRSRSLSHPAADPCRYRPSLFGFTERLYSNSVVAPAGGIAGCTRNGMLDCPNSTQTVFVYGELRQSSGWMASANPPPHHRRRCRPRCPRPRPRPRRCHRPLRRRCRPGRRHWSGNCWAVSAHRHGS